MRIGRVILLLICFATIALAQQSSITPELLRPWLTYLASDELEGRATFSEGLGLAAAYIVDQLKEAGVKPGGDHGSYFADYPTVPIDKIVAQLNMDMAGRNHDNMESESNTAYPVGSDRISTELHNIMMDANAGLTKPMTLDFQLNDPTDPERVYYRSDHYNYAVKGIPVIFFTTFLHPDYHRPTDSVEKINFDKLAHIAQFIYEAGRRLGNLDHAPVRDQKGPRLGKGGQGKILASN